MFYSCPTILHDICGVQFSPRNVEDMIISGFKNFFEKKFDELPKSYQILLVILVVTIVNSLASAMIIMIEQPYQEEINRQIDGNREASTVSILT